MAAPRSELADPKQWEILGAFFAYFAVAKDIPEVLRKLGITHLFSHDIKDRLLNIHSSADSWLLWSFSLLTMLLLLWLLWRNKTPVDRGESGDQNTLKDAYSDHTRIRTIRSLGLYALRQLVLNAFQVLYFDNFKRPSTWAEERDNFQYVDRFGFKNGQSFEFQYPKNFSALAIRVQENTPDRKFSAPVLRKPTFREMTLLMFGSNFFPFWFVGYTARKILWNLYFGPLLIAAVIYWLVIRK